MTEPDTVKGALFSPQQIAAYLRAIYQAAITFVGTALLTKQTTNISWEDALIGAGIAALFILGFRGAGEGFYDRNRAIEGDIHPSDVGAYSPPIPKN